MKKLCSFLVIILCFVWSSAASSSPSFVTVEAEGEAAIVGSGVSSARTEAKRAMSRNAVEKGIGAYVEGATKMKDFEVLSDKVFSQSKGVVSKIEVLDEGRRGGVYYMRARCRIATEALDGVLGPALIDAIGNPRVVVLVDETLDGQPIPSIDTGKNVSGAFYKAGYMILDSVQLAALNPVQLAAEIQRGNPEAVRTVLSQTGADIIVTAKIVSHRYARQRIEGVMIHAVESSVQLKGVSTQNAHLLAERSFTAKAQGVSAESAASKAASQASQKAARGMVYQLAYSLINGQAGAVGGRTVTLNVEGIAYANSRMLKQQLESAKGILAVYQRSYSNGQLSFDVVIDGTAEDIAAAASDLGVDIREVVQDKVTGRWRNP